MNTNSPPVTRRNPRLAWLGLALAGLAVHALPAAASDAPDPLNSTWQFSLGMYAVARFGPRGSGGRRAGFTSSVSTVKSSSTARFRDESTSPSTP